MTDCSPAAILTAFGLTQFSTLLPANKIQPDRYLIVSHMEPFGARLDMEIIETPQPLSGDRSTDTYEAGGSTRYIHFILNQRTIPLGESFPQCGKRDDGWCELTTFFEVQSSKLQEAQYEYSCFGKYPSVPYGTLNNGVPGTNSTGTTPGRSTCPTDGIIVCDGTSKFGLCNFGEVTFQQVAAGTKCLDGKIIAA